MKTLEQAISEAGSAYRFARIWGVSDGALSRMRHAKKPYYVTDLGIVQLCYKRK